MPVNTADLGPGGTANQPGGLGSRTGIGWISSSTSGAAIQPVYAFSDSSLGFYQSGASAIAQSYGTFNLFSGNVVMSYRTYADAPSNISIGQWGFIQNASGFSVFYSSGKSIYYFGGSTLSAVQPQGFVPIYPQDLTPDAPTSMFTYADAPSGITIGQWGFIQNASGFSVFYSSGKSIYYWGGSTLSAVQP